MYSFVIPTFNSCSTLNELVARIVRSFNSIEKFEILLIDDGSTDNTWIKISEICQKNKYVSGIRLSRNYGQHNALLCGIREARGTIIVTLDDDLQHPPEEIKKLLEQIEKGYDVVYGTPKKKSHNFARFMLSKITKLALQKTMGATVASQISAFRAFKAKLRESFVNFEGSDANIDVLLTWATNHFSVVKVQHRPRRYGNSGYSTIKLIKHAMNMMTGFSTRPLKFATLIGFLFSLLGFMIFGYVLLSWLTEGSTVPGFPFLASIISIFSGAQLIALGIIGEYLARVHVRTTNCPSFTISERTKN